MTATARVGPAFVVGGDALGTPDARWLDWDGLAALPELEVQVPVRGASRLVVVAPHPDDEVLAVGGIMRRVVDAGGTVAIAAVTDGEACRLDWVDLDVAERRAVRRAEVVAALAALGVEASVVHLALPDGDVAGHEDALTEHLVASLSGATWCLAPWTGDGHPDHEAAGRAALAAGARVGVPVGEFPVWAWHWAVPGDERIPWARARRMTLAPEVRAAKASAIAAFRSQLEPAGADADAVLPAPVVARFTRPFEVVFA